VAISNLLENTENNTNEKSRRERDNKKVSNMKEI
jgi:hypothetical protein